MKHKHFSKVMCIVLACMLLLTAIPVVQTLAASDAAQLYVATDGNDAAAGDSINAPLQTLEAARDKIREMKNNGTYPAGGVVVNIMGGEYLVLGDSFTLEAQDSGIAAGPVIYRAYNNEEVIFRGGLEVDGSDFEAITDESILARLDDAVEDNVLVYDITALHGITEFAPYPQNGMGWDTKVIPFDLSVDGVMQTLSRYPNTDFVQTAQILDPGFIPRNHIPFVDGLCVKCSQEQGVDVPSSTHTQAWFADHEGGVFTVNNAALTAKYDQLIQETELWAFGYWSHNWADDRCSVAEIEKTNTGLQITLGNPAWYGLGQYYGLNAPVNFYLFNALCEIDTPGEYYLDRENGKLYYYPAGDLADSEVSFIMQPNSLVVMNGAKHVQWQNVSFADGNASGMEMINTEYVEVAGCGFENFGKQAIELTGYNNTIRSCDITNIGVNGIRMSGGDIPTLTRSNNLVINCDISNYGRIVRTPIAGVYIYGGCGASVVNNRIYNGPHMGIYFNGPYTTIEGNEIFDVLYETGDAGAIYCGRTWHGVRGSVIKNNYIHDLGTQTGGRYAVYNDDNASGVTVTENLFVNIAGTAVLNGGGRDIEVTNNIQINNGISGMISHGSRKWPSLAGGPNGELIRPLMALFADPNFDEDAWRAQFPEVFEIDLENYEYQENNYEGFKYFYYNATLPAGAVITKNIAVGVTNPYGNIGDETKELGTVQDNQQYAAGTNIGFTNAANGVYTVIEGSTIKQLMGDNHFNADECGLYTDEYRTSLPGGIEAELDPSKSIYQANEQMVSSRIFGQRSICRRA